MRLPLTEQAEAAVLLQGKLGIDDEITCVSKWEVDPLHKETLKAFLTALDKGLEGAESRFTIIVLEHDNIEV